MSNCRIRDLERDLARHLGETVTIFTTSGGESGEGFTGVLIGIFGDFVRLLSDIGPAPACALGSCCSRRSCRNNVGDIEEDFENERSGNRNRNRIECRLRNVGAVVDIPVERIAAFVHNAI